MGSHEGEDPRRPEALHREGDVAAPVDHAGDSGSVAPQYLEDASGYRGHAGRVIIPADEAGVIAALREASAGRAPIPNESPLATGADAPREASAGRTPIPNESPQATGADALHEASAGRAPIPNESPLATGTRAPREASAGRTPVPNESPLATGTRALHEASAGHAPVPNESPRATGTRALHEASAGRTLVPNESPRATGTRALHEASAGRTPVPNESPLAARRGGLREAFVTGVPVTIAAAGTGITGGRVPFGGWVLSVEKLNRLEIHAGYAIVGAGVPLRDLQAAAQRSSQFYPPDPTENSAFIGGTIATNASGSRSFKFGSTRRWIERLRVVLADGRLLDIGRGEPIDFDPGAVPLPAVTKNTAGYLLRPGMDWIDLFVGSEGTLGVVTEAHLRLLPAPPAVLAGVVFFPSDTAALDAVDQWRSSEARMLEYLDEPSLQLLRARFPEIPAAAKAAILFDQALTSEDDPEVDRWLDRVQSAGAFDEESWFALSAADRERFRHFRHSLPELVNDAVRRAGALKMNTDYAVPIARNREMLGYYRRRLDEDFPGRYVIFGHIGDAHVHVNIFSDPANPAAAGDLLREFAGKAVALGGTVSAEHGVGKRKAHLLELQYSPADLDLMRAVKRRLDPANILGRGTLFTADAI